MPKQKWPTQQECMSFYGRPGTNQTSFVSPYPMYLAWDKGTKISKFSCHVKVKDSLERVLKTVLATYGIEEIKKLRLDSFGGCLNVRKMRGGSAWSMHSWGIALDFDPERNDLRMDHFKAQFAKPEYVKWFEAWEAEGWISLGRARDFDWMHVQAARLG